MSTLSAKTTLVIESRCRPGDLWQLGEHHRILCGDSTDVTNLYRLIAETKPCLVFADPPYGINLIPKSGHLGKSNRKYKQIVGDESTATAIRSYQLFTSLFVDAVHVWWGANYYANVLPPSRCWLVWDKENGPTSFADAELAWCSHKSGVRVFRHRWNGFDKASERGQPRYSPCQKPIALAQWIFETYGRAGDAIFDPFLGSGISVLAAETLRDRRRVFGCDIDPYYCDVCIARWEQYTGHRALKLNE